jgi:hypothetical protein
MNRTVFVLSAAAFCALLMRPVQASWVIAPTVVIALSLLLLQASGTDGRTARPGKKSIRNAVLLALLFAAVFLIVWLRTGRLVSLRFFDWRAALPLLLTVLVCAPCAVPWLACAAETLSDGAAEAPALPAERQRLNREEKRLVFCCALAAVSICSLSSPLYAFNNWVDANCFMTVGKSMLYGVVPYRDLYEQKGPLLYALYALCYLVSHTSFLGAWLLEILASFFFLLLSCRTFLLFNEKLSAPFVFLTAALTYTAPAFLKGGSAEELSLPLLMLACFYGLRALRQKKELSLRECFFIGLSAGAVLWIKYSMLGFYVGFILVPAYRMIRGHRAGRLILQLCVILLGVVLASLPILLYFGINGALKDLWTAYFYNNLFVYGKSSSPFAIVRALGSGLASMLTFNDAAALLFLFGAVGLWREGERAQALHVCFCFVFAFGLIYAGGIQMKYYSEILCIFIPVGLAQLWRLIAGMHPAPLPRQRLQRVLLPLLFTLALFGTENNGMLTVRRADLPQYQFRETVLQTPDATLFNYGALDVGLFTVCDIVPSTRYFCMLNLPSEEMFREMDRYMAEGATDYIVSRGLPVESGCYRLVQTSSFPDDGTDYPFYLYQKVNPETP